MKMTKHQFPMEMIAFVASLVVVVVSGIELGGQVNTPRLIGLIAGSFGAGAVLANAIRSRVERRRQVEEKEKEAA